MLREDGRLIAGTDVGLDEQKGKGAQKGKYTAVQTRKSSTTARKKSFEGRDEAINRTEDDKD